MVVDLVPYPFCRPYVTPLSNLLPPVLLLVPNEDERPSNGLLKPEADEPADLLYTEAEVPDGLRNVFPVL